MTTMMLMGIEQAEFDALAAQTRLGEDAREMARLVLVEGRKMGEVAQIYKVTRQRVGLAVGSIRKVHEGGASGPGWVPLNMDVPASLGVELTEFLEALKLAATPESKALAISHVTSALSLARKSLV